MNIREWYTAAELAEMTLPGLPTTRRNISETAKRDGWKSRPRKGRGGGNEYHLSSFPPVVQARLVVHLTAGKPLSKPKGKSDRAGHWAHYDSLPDTRKAKALQRLEVLQEVETLHQGGTPVDIAVRQIAALRGMGISTIHLWRSRVAGVEKSDWLAYLADHYTGRTSTTKCSPDAWEMVKSDYLRLEKPRFTDCYRRVIRAAKDRGWDVPSERTLYRRLTTTVSPAIIVLAREGREAVAKMYPAQERDRSVFHAMEAVNTDGHRWDLWVEWPDGTVARPMMVGFQDLYSGKILSWRVDNSENSWAVRLAWGDMVDQFGIPGHCYFDNGRAFASKWMTGGVPNRYRFKVKDEEPTGIVTQMGVSVHWTTPYHGQSKPIERAWRDFANTIARHPAFAGAWTGNTIANKPENYRSKAIPLDDFLKIVSSEIAEHNARPGRQTRVCRGTLSFDEAFDASYAQSAITKATDEQRRLWLLAAEGITVASRDGAMRLMENRYWAEWLHKYRGEKVVARFDPDALWDGIEVYRLDGAYLGHADCVEAAGFADANAAREHGRQRRRWLRAQRDMLDAERRMSPTAVAALVPSQTAPEPPQGQIIALPRPVHDLRRTPVSTLTVEQQARRDAMVHDFPQAPVAEPTDAEKKRARFASAQAIASRLAAGEEVSETDAAWLSRYQVTAEYRAFASIAADFGSIESA